MFIIQRITISFVAFFSLTASVLALSIPAGFIEQESSGGVTVWQKGAEYVQVIAPQRGARLIQLHGAKQARSRDQKTQFARRTVADWWQHWSRTEPGLISLLNGQFFDPRDPDQAPLAFSTKAWGRTEAGYGDQAEFAGRKRVLRVRRRHSNVQPYTDDVAVLQRLTEPDLLIGLEPTVDKASRYRRGRTFLATTRHGTILIFSSPAATQRYATRILLAFGAIPGKIMMLDGGGSTQLMYRGEVVIPEPDSGKTLRPVPHVLGVVRSSNRAYSGNRALH